MTPLSEIYCYYKELGISKQQNLQINKHNFCVLFGSGIDLRGFYGSLLE